MLAEDRDRLAPAAHDRIFTDQILPDLARDQQTQLRPLAVLLGGQPGIGKSSTKSAVVSALRSRGGVLDFSADLLRPYHPRFAELLAGDERELAALDAAIDLDARAWVDRMIKYSTANRFHAIVDSNLASPDRAQSFIDRFSEAGYRVEVLFVAGPAALSRLGVLQRFAAQVAELGHGAYCAPAIQDRNYAGILQTAGMLDRTVGVDRVAVNRRGGTMLHEQRRERGRWVPAAAARAAITAERDRFWTGEEQAWYIEAVRSVLPQLGPAYLPDLRAACVLAEPLFDPSGSNREELDTLVEAIADGIAQRDHAPADTHRETRATTREQLDRSDRGADPAAAEPDPAAPGIYGEGSEVARLAGMGFGETTSASVERRAAHRDARADDRTLGVAERSVGRETESEPER